MLEGHPVGGGLEAAEGFGEDGGGVVEEGEAEGDEVDHGGGDARGGVEGGGAPVLEDLVVYVEGGSLFGPIF